jgi:protein TonB
MKDYASLQRNPRKHLLGILFVILFHLALLWVIHSGLAKKFVKIIKGPVEAQLIEDVKPDIPPPPPPPPPKSLPPPPDYVPPPDIVNTSVSSANSITGVSSTPAPVPVQAVAPAPVVIVAPVINVAANCQKPSYPSASVRNEEEGTVQLKFLIGVDGKVIETKVEKTSGFSRLDEAAIRALSKCDFKPGTVNGKPEQSWARVDYKWKLE